MRMAHSHNVRSRRTHAHQGPLGRPTFLSPFADSTKSLQLVQWAPETVKKIEEHFERNNLKGIVDISPVLDVVRPAAQWWCAGWCGMVNSLTVRVTHLIAQRFCSVCASSRCAWNLCSRQCEWAAAGRMRSA